MRSNVPLLLCGSLLTCIGLLIVSARADNILCLLGAPPAAQRAAHQAWWDDTLLPQLARAGHNLTVLTSLVPRTSSAAYGANVHYIHIDDVPEQPLPSSVPSAQRWWSWPPAIWANSAYAQIVDRFSAANAADTALVHTTAIHELLNLTAAAPFDLILHDHGRSPVLLGFVQHFGFAPLVSASPTAAASAVTLGALAGAAAFASYQPHTASAYAPFAELGILERARNASYDLFEWFYRRFVYMRNANRKAQQVFGADVLALEQLEQRTELVLTNVAFGIDAARLLPPNVLAVGGLQAQRNQTIAPALRRFLDGTADGGGVIYVNLGSRLADGWRRVLTQVFGQLREYRFVWYTEGRRLRFLPANVFGAGEQLPQAAILAHPNIRLVITNGGRLSVQEAIWNALPMLAMCETIEQKRQLAGASAFGSAETMPILLHPNHPNAVDLIAQRIRTMLANHTQHVQQARQLRAAVFGSQFGTPLERAAHAIEHVLRRGNASELQLRNRHLYFVQTYLLDVCALVALLAAGFAAIFVKNCRWRRAAAVEQPKTKSE